MTLLDLMNQPGAYPYSPGFKTSGPSQEAAGKVNAKTLRDRVVSLLYPALQLTADEAADLLGLSPFSVRPRFSELRRMGKIVDAGIRRKNAFGNSVTVWRLV